MALTVEDGTGLAAANSYVSVSDADTYALTVSNATWSALSNAAKETFLITAFQVLNDAVRFPYVGTRKTSTQAGLWPRLNAVELNGPDIGPTIIPTQLKQASINLALLQASGDTSSVSFSVSGASNIKRKKVDVLEREYFSPMELGAASPLSMYPYNAAVDGILRPLLRDDRFKNLAPVADATLVAPSGQFFTQDMNLTTNLANNKL